MTSEYPRVVASQLPLAFNRVFQRVMPETRIVTASLYDNLQLEPHIEILLAAPYCQADETPPEKPPPGWPFGLKWIQLSASGLDYYPRWFWQVPQVTTLRGAAADALAEFALAMIFAHTKHVPSLWIDAAIDWQMRILSDVSGTALGILGYGSVARALIPRAEALGMRVVVCRRSAEPLEHDSVARADSFEELVAMSDHLVLAASDTPETRKIVNARSLQSARPGLHLINLSRGTLVDDVALIDALDDGRVARASLDVTQPEPLLAGHPFYGHPKVYLSPHIGVMTTGTMQNISEMFALNLDRFVRGKPLRNLVARPADGES